jgi:hypothetical protein
MEIIIQALAVRAENGTKVYFSFYLDLTVIRETDEIKITKFSFKLFVNFPYYVIDLRQSFTGWHGFLAMSMG